MNREDVVFAGDPTVASFARDWLPRIEARLVRILDEQSGPGGLLIGPMRYLLDAGGKRLRPLLVVGTCEAGGGDALDALDGACAIELIHTASLILDDLPCMDDACSRRGVPPLHRVYDEATAILTAIALLNLSHGLLAKQVARIRRSRDDLHVAVATLIGPGGMVAGQYLDLRQAAGIPAPVGVDPIGARLAKTSALVAAAVLVGAHAAGATTRQVETLRRFAFVLGDAYQILDDRADSVEDGVDGGEEGRERHAAAAAVPATVHEACRSLRSEFEDSPALDRLCTLAELVTSRLVVPRVLPTARGAMALDMAKNRPETPRSPHTERIRNA